MRSVDLEVGVDYAIAEYPRQSPLNWRRATLIEIGPRRCAVKYAEGNWGERDVPNRRIVSTWADAEATRAAVRDQEVARRAAYDQEAAARNQARARLTALVPDEALPWWARSDSPDAKPYADYSGVHGLDDGSRHGTTVVDLLTMVEAALTQQAARAGGKTLTGED